MTQDYYDYSSDEEVIEFRRRNEEARRARQKARQKYFDEPEDTDTRRVIQVARDARSRIEDDYLDTANKSKEQDRRTMEYIDSILNQTTPIYGSKHRASAPLSWRPRQNTSNRGTQFDFYDGIDGIYNDPEVQNGVSYSSARRYPNRDERSPTIGRNRINKPVSETARQRVRRIEAKLDGILDYELPSAENFKNMRHSLREISDKMATHKLMLDRRSKYEVDDDNSKVSERIDQKYRELEERMPCLTMSERNRNRTLNTSFDPTLIPGYVTGLSITNSEQTAELRGRIRTLLCRTRRTTGSDDTHTNAGRRRRGMTVN